MSAVLSSAKGIWVPPRLRPDLAVSMQKREGRRTAIIKDPLARAYFKLSADDHQVARLLDGRRDCSEVAAAAADHGILADESHVAAVARALFDRGLLVATPAFLKARQRARHARQANAGWLSWLFGLLFARVPLMDPDALLTRLEKKLRWCWSRTAFRLYALLFLAGLAVVIVRAGELPEAFQRSINLPNLLVAWVLLVVVKVLHEFGHGLTCKHYGGEVRELGMLVIVLSPFFYVNVTDSYLFPRKHQRILVAAAGIAVELVIAAMAAMAWAASRPGPAQEVLFSLMTITSVWTVLFNANPLMKFDGYYMLSDWTGIANLRSRSMNAAMAVLDRLLFGSSPLDSENSRSGGGWLAAFGLASMAYLLVVIAGLTAVLRWFAAEAELKWAGELLGALVLFGMLGVPVWHYLRERIRWLGGLPGGIWQRTWIGRLVTGFGLVALLLFLPIPVKPVRQAVILPVHTAVIRAEVAGTLSKLQIKTGQNVRKGDLLLVLQNPSLQAAVLAAESHVEAARLAEARLLGAEAPGLLAEARAELDAARALLKAARESLQKTAVRSPVDGLVVTPELDSQTGRGYRPGEVLCEIVSAHQLEAMVPVEESSVDDIPLRTPALIRAQNDPATAWASSVSEAGQTEPFRQLPASISEALEKDLAVITDAGGNMVPVETYFGVRVPIPEQATALIKPGMRGSVQFDRGTSPLGAWLWLRWLEFVDPMHRL
jgi:putative peptide zinc metalloprotease protein